MIAMADFTFIILDYLMAFFNFLEFAPTKTSFCELYAITVIMLVDAVFVCVNYTLCGSHNNTLFSSNWTLVILCISSFTLVRAQIETIRAKLRK